LLALEHHYYPGAHRRISYIEMQTLAEVQKVLWFSRFPVTRFHKEGDVAVVEISDIRFVQTRRDTPSFTYRVLFGTDGSVLSQGWATRLGQAFLPVILLEAKRNYRKFVVRRVDDDLAVFAPHRSFPCELRSYPSTPYARCGARARTSDSGGMAGGSLHAFGGNTRRHAQFFKRSAR